jgi:hypothetical protein
MLPVAVAKRALTLLYVSAWLIASTLIAEAQQQQKSTQPSPPKVLVPNVMKKAEAEARYEIQKAGLETGDIERKHGQIKDGIVLDQKPRPGELVPLKTKISLLVSAGPPSSPSSSRPPGQVAPGGNPSAGSLPGSSPTAPVSPAPTNPAPPSATESQTATDTRSGASPVPEPNSAQTPGNPAPPNNNLGSTAASTWGESAIKAPRVGTSVAVKPAPTDPTQRDATPDTQIVRRDQTARPSSHQPSSSISASDVPPSKSPAPTVTLSANRTTGVAGETIVFQIAVEPFDENLEYRIDFGDTNRTDWEKHSKFHHAYGHKGEYWATGFIRTPNSSQELHVSARLPMKVTSAVFVPWLVRTVSRRRRRGQA